MSETQVSAESFTFKDEIISSLQKNLINWGKKNYQNYLWRKPKRKWHALVAEIFLQRTKVKNVMPVYSEFIRTYSSISKLSKAPITEIEKMLLPLGLKWRAKYLKELIVELEKRKGKIPKDYQKLVKLPGVGHYVASAWLSFHAKKRAIIIDANIVRWLCRLFGVEMDGETRRKEWVKKNMELITPLNNFKEFNYAILDFTMTVCKKKPNCFDCPITPTLCLFKCNQLSRSN